MPSDSRCVVPSSMGRRYSSRRGAGCKPPPLRSGVDSARTRAKTGRARRLSIMAVKFENLVELCERSCHEFKDRQLFGVKQGGAWTWITYGEFGEMVDAFRGGLAHVGVGRGDVVAIVAQHGVGRDS